ncbi:hypothetical protein DAI22_08g156000 [Oryza sativa Japonica Group]|nr:hypothetical protein DAI22_08g156000 [Oryza sativa Japonica Group]
MDKIWPSISYLDGSALTRSWNRRALLSPRRLPVPDPLSLPSPIGDSVAGSRPSLQSGCGAPMLLQDLPSPSFWSLLMSHPARRPQSPSSLPYPTSGDAHVRFDWSGGADAPLRKSYYGLVLVARNGPRIIILRSDGLWTISFPINPSYRRPSHCTAMTSSPRASSAAPLIFAGCGSLI